MIIIIIMNVRLLMSHVANYCVSGTSRSGRLNTPDVPCYSSIKSRSRSVAAAINNNTVNYYMHKAWYNDKSGRSRGRDPNCPAIVEALDFNWLYFHMMMKRELEPHVVTPITIALIAKRCLRSEVLENTSPDELL